MSKIPQGEWSAIAARYAKGESISRIAQTYGCTPPAIHYILKQGKLRAAQNPERRLNGTPVGECGEENGIARLVPGEVRPADRAPVELRPAHEPATPMTGERSQAVPAQRAAGGASALTAGLDRELHGRAEAAIAAFRSSFDAALAEGSPGVRQRLRQAASDLMRVAARTTIVLDRLNANAERGPVRMPDHLKWSNGR
jgi:hypothetical protein